MTAGALFWTILFAVSGILFFGIAFVVSIGGISDLRDLLGKSGGRKTTRGSRP